MPVLAPHKYQAIRREQAGKDAYRRFANAMAEFRAAIAEMEELESQPKPDVCGPFKPKKITTPLRANGYRIVKSVRE